MTTEPLVIFLHDYEESVVNDITARVRASSSEHYRRMETIDLRPRMQALFEAYRAAVLAADAGPVNAFTADVGRKRLQQGYGLPELLIVVDALEAAVWEGAATAWRDRGAAAWPDLRRLAAAISWTRSGLALAYAEETKEEKAILRRVNTPFHDYLRLRKEAAPAAAAPGEEMFLEGVVADFSGDADRAVELYQRALELDPGNVAVLIHLGVTYYHRAAVAAATRILEDVVRRAPDNAPAHYYLGLCYYRLARGEEAAASLKKTLALEPDAEIAYYWLGVVYYFMGKLHEAVAAYTELLARSPEFIIAHYQRGIAYARLGMRDEAIADLERVLAHNPQSAQAYALLGEVAYGKGDIYRARAALAKAVELDPEDKKSHNLLDLILGS